MPLFYFIFFFHRVLLLYYHAWMNGVFRPFRRRRFHSHDGRCHPLRPYYVNNNNNTRCL
jgi:hypothetical protein